MRGAKDKFLAVVADQRAKFDVMKLQESEFFEQSVPSLTQAVYGIQNFLPAAQWNDLHAILKDYRSHHKSEFGGGLKRTAAAFNAQLGKGKTYSQTLLGFLDRFGECIDKFS